MINLYPHQEQAIASLNSGSILCGGVGSGKSLTALAYFVTKECGGVLGTTKVSRPKSLYIITTARKRDTLEWEKECSHFLLAVNNPEASLGNIEVQVDSWNNIKKYAKDIHDAFFIFDEQRIVGSGSWAKSFIKIAKVNRWILLTATPGDTWSDYIPAFIANGFYKNRTAFLKRHAVYSRYTKFPKIERYVDCGVLIKYKRDITVYMDYEKKTLKHHVDVITDYDRKLYKTIFKDRWNPFKEEPIAEVSSLFYTVRQAVNADPSRLKAVEKLLEAHDRAIIFYNFNYELDILKTLSEIPWLTVAEYNGHKHEEIPDTKRWVYLVQYTAGAEGWNCVETDTIIFYSPNYSYKLMTQAAGRIDRLNTPFEHLYYYHLLTKSTIDLAIGKALRSKRAFNENTFLRKQASRAKHSL